uniref:Uncharacterized protein n=1 Tax=Glossina brevipalpis TaxID=37001 RepID=A0A1A9WBT0_9MUSC
MQPFRWGFITVVLLIALTNAAIINSFGNNDDHIESTYPLDVQRRKRSGRGYMRGQTQSQYLNFGKPEVDGKAEAEANESGSRSTVSGTHGMGQAQSQFSMGDCSECPGTIYEYPPGSPDPLTLSGNVIQPQPSGPLVSGGFQPAHGFVSGKPQAVTGLTGAAEGPDTRLRPAVTQFGIPSRGPGIAGDLRPGQMTVPGKLPGTPGYYSDLIPPSEGEISSQQPSRYGPGIQFGVREPGREQADRRVPATHPQGIPGQPLSTTGQPSVSGYEARQSFMPPSGPVYGADQRFPTGQPSDVRIQPSLRPSQPSLTQIPGPPQPVISRPQGPSPVQRGTIPAQPVHRDQQVQPLGPTEQQRPPFGPGVGQQPLIYGPAVGQPSGPGALAPAPGAGIFQPSRQSVGLPSFGAEPERQGPTYGPGFVQPGTPSETFYRIPSGVAQPSGQPQDTAIGHQPPGYRPGSIQTTGQPSGFVPGHIQRPAVGTVSQPTDYIPGVGMQHVGISEQSAGQVGVKQPPGIHVTQPGSASQPGSGFYVQQPSSQSRMDYRPGPQQLTQPGTSGSIDLRPTGQRTDIGYDQLGGFSDTVGGRVQFGGQSGTTGIQSEIGTRPGAVMQPGPGVGIPQGISRQPHTEFTPSVQPGTAFTPAIQPGAGFVQPGTEYTQPGTRFVQPGRGFVQPQTETAQPSTGFVQPGTGFAQPGPGIQPGSGFLQPGQGRQPSIGYPQHEFRQPGTQPGVQLPIPTATGYGPGSRPDIEKQPGIKPQPGIGLQPWSDVQPGYPSVSQDRTLVQPSTQPGIGIQPGISMQPGPSVQPGIVLRPGTVTQPGIGVPSGAGMHPGIGAQPGASMQPGIGISPGIGYDQRPVVPPYGVQDYGQQTKISTDYRPQTPTVVQPAVGFDISQGAAAHLPGSIVSSGGPQPVTGAIGAGRQTGSTIGYDQRGTGTIYGPPTGLQTGTAEGYDQSVRPGMQPIPAYGPGTQIGTAPTYGQSSTGPIPGYGIESRPGAGGAVQYGSPYVTPPQEMISAGTDDAFSQAESSINNGQAVASAQGKKNGGTAKTQVQGTYSSTGSFTASAMTSDNDRSASSQVSGGLEGAMSQAQGQGGAAQSQAQVQVNEKTGGTKSSSQSGGLIHQSQSEVQANDKGGLADAQSSGPGQTSSQAQIGFRPGQDGEIVQSAGGGQASAQSGTHSGQSQSQIQGRSKFGVSYHGAAQSASGTKEQVANYREQNRHLFNTISQFGGADAITDRVDTMYSPTALVPESDAIPDVQLKTSKAIKKDDDDSNLADDDEEEPYDEYDDDDEYYNESPIKMDSKSSGLTQNQKNIDHDTTNSRPDSSTSFRTHTQKSPSQVQQTTVADSNKKYTVVQNQNGRVQTYSSRSTTEAVPSGFRGTVNVEKKFHTKALGSHKIDDKANVTSTITGDEKSITKLRTPDSFVTVTKSITGSLDNSKNPPQDNKNFQSTYYTKSSTCGYFTFSCNIVYGANGRSKVCRPKAPTNGKC